MYPVYYLLLHYRIHAHAAFWESDEFAIKSGKWLVRRDIHVYAGVIMPLHNYMNSRSVMEYRDGLTLQAWWYPV